MATVNIALINNGVIDNIIACDNSGWMPSNSMGTPVIISSAMIAQFGAISPGWTATQSGSIWSFLAPA